MMGQTTGLEKSVKCTAAVAAWTLAKFGADDDTLSTAAAATDNVVGVFQHATTAAGQEVRVMLSGISRVKAGGTIARGDLIGSDATGQGVTVAPAAGTNNRVVGIAMASGVSGDIIPVSIVPSRVQG
jgi:hypothetical protein